jgi:hypothetical protein
MPTIDRLDSSFEERNVFLHAVLGLISLCRRFEALLEEQAMPPAATVALDPDSTCAEARARATASAEEVAEDAVLGLIVLSRQILAHAEAAQCGHETGAVDAARRAPEPATADPTRLRGLLV